MTIKTDEIQLDNIRYIKAKSNNTQSNNNHKFYMIKYKNGKRYDDFVFQVPEFKHTRVIKYLNGSNVIAELEVPVSNLINKKQKKFINFLHNFEDKIIEDGKNNSNEWFKNTSQLTKSKLNIKYKTLIREIGNESVIKIKIINSNSFKTKIIDEKSNVIDIKNLELNKEYDIYLSFLLEIYGICIDNNSFCLIVRTHKIRARHEQAFKEHEFIDESDSDSDEDDDIIFSHVNGDEYADLIDTDINSSVNKLNKSTVGTVNNTIPLYNLLKGELSETPNKQMISNKNATDDNGIKILKPMNDSLLFKLQKLHYENTNNSAHIDTTIGMTELYDNIESNTKICDYDNCNISNHTSESINDNSDYDNNNICDDNSDYDNNNICGDNSDNYDNDIDDINN
jgi:hypothetical protein